VGLDGGRVDLMMDERYKRLYEPKGRVTLAYKDLTEVSRDIFLKPSRVIILDLSYNHLSNFQFLQILTNLTTLVLDRNKITSHTQFPSLPNLEVLWVNDNQITNIALFVDNISAKFPSLKHLSMMKNDAAPSYFNGASKRQYIDYRYYIISQLPRLYALDDTVISHDERNEARRVYGPKLNRQKRKVK
jgi:hypothetical protein